MERRLVLAGLGAATAFGALAARGSAQELTTIAVGAGSIEPHAEVRYAEERGSFRRRGLDAQIETLRNGAAIAAAVVGGDLQFGISNVLQLTQAYAHHVPVSIVALAGVHDARFPHSGLVVAASSTLQSAKELNGAVVGVPTLSGLDQLGASALIDKSGGDSGTVRFVEVAPAASVEALLDGRVAAVALEDPAFSAALAGKSVRSLGDVDTAIAPHFVTTAWFANADWLAASASNKDVTRRFAAGIYEAGAWANANPVAAAVILARDFHTTEPRAVERFATAYDPAALQVTLDVCARYKYAPPTKAADLVWSV